MPASASESAEADGHGYHRHHAAVFLGGAVRAEHSTESTFAIGFEYEYRLVKLVGAGLLAEVATGELREAVIVAPLALHPWRGLRLVAAPGIEIPSEGHTAFLMRLGIAYQIPIRNFTLGPEFNVDLIHGEPTYVVGPVSVLASERATRSAFSEGEVRMAAWRWAVVVASPRNRYQPLG